MDLVCCSQLHCQAYVYGEENCAGRGSGVCYHNEKQDYSFRPDSDNGNPDVLIPRFQQQLLRLTQKGNRFQNEA